MNKRISVFGVLFFLTVCAATAQRAKKAEAGAPATAVGATAPVGKVWTARRPMPGMLQHPWLTGADFLPQTAINQLEMWQAETFDRATIDRELGWASRV